MFGTLAQQMNSVGAPVILALVLTSIVATATTIFKVVQLARLGVGRHRAARAAVVHWQGGDRIGALRLADEDTSSLGRVTRAAMASLLVAPGDHVLARDVATHAATQALNAMEQRMRILDAVVQAAPMLGLLGTVIGMIDAFGALSQSGGAVDPGALAEGIWTALATTAIGLSIAIPFYFVSVWLEGRLEGERAAMEFVIGELVDHRPTLHGSEDAPSPLMEGARRVAPAPLA